MGVRTTPFGHFASVAPGMWDVRGPLKIAFPQRVERTLVKPSLRFLQMITVELCKVLEIRNRLKVKVNRTLRLRSDRLEFIKRAGEKLSLVDAAEAVVSVKRTRLVEHVLQLASDSPITAGELTRALTPECADPAVVDRARNYINGLIDQQILELEHIFTEHSMNPLRDIISFLSGLQDLELARGVSACLREVENILIRFTAASSDDRENALDDLRVACTRVFELLKLPPGRLERNLLFEDAVLDSNPRQLNDSWFWKFESDLCKLATLRPLSDSKLSDQLNIARVFKNKYGCGGICQDILEFWRSYLTDSKPNTDSSRPDQHVWSSGSDPRITAGKLMATAYADAARSGARTWNLDPELVSEQISELWTYYPPCDFAHDLFCQIVRTAGETALVFNSVNPGWGKYLSRFCHLFNGKDDRNPLLDSMRTFANRHCTSEAVLCDILGTFSHNANLRPNITEHELDYPGVESGRPPEYIVRLDDIELRHDPTFDAVRLYHKGSGQEILPLHLGFLSHLWVPSFYRFLTLFGPGWGGWPINMSFIQSTETALSCTLERPVVHFPRITLGQLVLRRAFWKVAANHMPQIAQAESDFDAYLMLVRWWLTQGLPSECLMKPLWESKPVGAGTEPAEPDAAECEPKDETPSPVAKKKVWSYVLEGQYFNIDNFFAVMLLVRTLRSSPQLLLLEEMFSPDLSPVVEIDGESHMTEFVVEMAYSRQAA
jgi:hypothetical protein